MIEKHTCEQHKIGIQIQGVYDGVLFWRCSYCDHEWHRFTKQSHPHLYRKAEQYIAKEGLWHQS